ncbi:MAG: hypothetical protein ABSA49_17250 [Rhizomicrobium sp.]|jgi:hypothetical protein
MMGEAVSRPLRKDLEFDFTFPYRCSKISAPGVAMVAVSNRRIGGVAGIDDGKTVRTSPRAHFTNRQHDCPSFAA